MQPLAVWNTIDFKMHAPATIDARISAGRVVLEAPFVLSKVAQIGVRIVHEFLF